MSKNVKVLYHITGYQNSRQFEWLYRAIYNEHDLFVLHIDKKAPSHIHDEFRRITGTKPNVSFLPSLSVVWGGNGLIDAELMAIHFGLDHDPSWTHIVNLTAQDYPLISPEAIREQLEASWPANFVLCNDIRNVHWRIRKRPLFRYVEWNNKRFFTPIPRVAPKDIHIGWVGPWWHILTREFCSWLVTDDKAHRYRRFLRDAGMPDEMLIQNVINDSPFKDRLISCCKHEILWRRPGEPRSSSARPKVYTVEELPALETSTAFFARKFDHRLDDRVMMAIASRQRLNVPEPVS